MLNSMDTNNHNVLDEAVKMKFEGTNVRVITIGDLGVHRWNHSGGDERHHLIREFLNTMRRHRYIKQLFLVLGTRLAQFKRYCSVVKCVLDGLLDTHI
jgi:hypothetical protein